MNPTVDQLCEQFGRLVASTPTDRCGSGFTPDASVTHGQDVGDKPRPTPPAPVQKVDHAAKGYDLNVSVAPGQVVAAAEILDRNGFGLDTITGVDWLAQQEMEVVYDYFHPAASVRVAVRTRVPRAEPEVPTISAVFPGANWHERETHDFFGLRFRGHPKLTPFLLPDDADYHPLRKDYQP